MTSGFMDYRRQRPSITPAEMGEALVAKQTRLEPPPDEDDLFPDAVAQAMARAQSQQTDAGMRRPR